VGKRNRERVVRIKAGLEEPRCQPAAERKAGREEVERRTKRLRNTMMLNPTMSLITLLAAARTRRIK